MSFIRVLLLFMFVIIGNACCTIKEKGLEDNNEMEVNKDSINVALTKEGFKKAIIVFNEQKEVPCKYLIQVENNLLIEPLHELESAYNVAELPVWVKYHPQRRMSRCEQAQPVEIIDIKKR